MSEHFSTEQKQWLDDYCNGTIEPEAFALLEADLMASREFRQLARSYLAMDSHLQQGIETLVLTDSQWLGVADPPVKTRRVSSQVWAIAAAVIFFLGLGLGGFLPVSPDLNEDLYEEQDDGIAVIQHSVDAVWESDFAFEPVEGSILSPGFLHLASGLIQLEFYNGARVILEGPVELEITSVNEVVCQRGRLRAFIPDSATGFTVLAPQFELVDLGTEFGVSVEPGGQSAVEVFDGEVELYPRNGQRRAEEKTSLTTGRGLIWTEEGKGEIATTPSGSFASFEDVRNRNEEKRRKQFRRWERWNESTKADPRILFHYDFEDRGSKLYDHGSMSRHGTIIGSERATGRWPEKGALEFKRPGDRVRIQIPMRYDELTLAAWIRMDAQTGRTQSLILTDGYETGRVHWQITNRGSLRLGIRLPSESGEFSGSGYGSPNFMGPKRIGTWNLVGTVYDRISGVVTHHLNGREISREELAYDQPVMFGPAEIGNWGLPYGSEKAPHRIRNFVGRIDTITAWKEAFTEEDIHQIYLQTRP